MTDPEDAPTRDLRTKLRDPDSERRKRLAGSYIGDKGVMTQEQAASERIQQMPRPPRDRRPSSVRARINVMDVMSMRVQSVEGWDLITDKAQATLFQIIGESFDAGDRRAEVKRLALEGELSGQQSRVLELEGKLAMVGADRDRARAKSTPPQMDVNAFDVIQRLKQRVTWLESELDRRGVRIDKVK